MDHSERRHFLYRLELLAAIGIWLAVCVVMDVSCIPRAITGIPCFSCGMSRAWLAVFRLDFAEAFTYHPMFWAVPVVAMLYLFVGQKTPKWCKILYCLLAAAYVLCYLVRLLLYFKGELIL